MTSVTRRVACVHANAPGEKCRHRDPDSVVEGASETERTGHSRYGIAPVRWAVVAVRDARARRRS
ncbi:hypothetical protein GCM10010330_41250 [Streptomyces tendae]|nr:hypothetical protein GCM10010330_41250 [Streptomyces tendae]